MLRLACVQDKHCRGEIVERTKRRIEPSDRYAQIIATITAAATLQAPAVAATRWRWDLMAGAQLPATRAASSGRESLLRALQIIIIVLLLNICSIAAVVDAAAGDEGAAPTPSAGSAGSKRLLLPKRAMFSGAACDVAVG